MDFYIDIGIAVILRLVQDQSQSNKYKRALLKIFKAIGARFRNDAEFEAAAKAVQHDRSLP